MSDERRQDNTGAHEREMRIDRLDATVNEMRLDIARIDKASAVLKQAIEGVPGLADSIKETIEEMAIMKADFVLKIAELRAGIKEELTPIKITVDALANAPGRKASSTISRVLWIVVPIVVIAVLSLLIYGIIHWLEAIPTIGNAVKK